MRKVTASAKTVDEAIEKALKELNVTRDDVEVRVIEAPQKGLFGLFKGKPATIEVVVKIDAVGEAKQFLQELIDKMGVTVTIEQREVEGRMIFDLKGEEIGYIIGKRGQTLDSLQFLTNLVANRYSDSYLRIQLDAENYRERRKKSLEQLANRLADKAIATKRAIKLEPMTGLERKIIHSALQDNEQVTTYSEGTEPRRRIVIAPK